MSQAGIAELLRRCGDVLGAAPRAQLSVRLTDDSELSALNAQFLGHAEPTDVLAFPADEVPGLPRSAVDRIGDIAISVERALLQPDGVAELRLLSVHGLLHCLGHDHAEDDDAAEMTAMTRSLLPEQTVPDL